MKAFINHHYRVAYVQTDNVEVACRMGRGTERDYSDTFNCHEGWAFFCIPTSRDLRRNDRQQGNVESIRELVEFIQAGTPRPIGFVGPFGEGEATG